MAGLLDGQVAVVTGGGRGIGRACSLELARAGATVVVNYATDQASANAVFRNILEEIFTVTHGGAFPASFHARDCAYAVLRTHSSMEAIYPIDSAIGMNRFDSSMPSVGCCHRTKASAPLILRVWMSTCGW